MDLSINFVYKKAITAAFDDWLTKQILNQIENGISYSNITIDESMSSLKVIVVKYF